MRWKKRGKIRPGIRVPASQRETRTSNTDGSTRRASKLPCFVIIVIFFLGKKMG
jgi:hypothetical protein